MSDATIPATFLPATRVLGHQDGVVILAEVDGESVGFLVGSEHRVELLTALSHSLSDAEITQFRDLLARQNR